MKVCLGGTFDLLHKSIKKLISKAFETAQEINLKRVENEKKLLKIIKIPFVLAENDKPISSTRI